MVIQPYQPPAIDNDDTSDLVQSAEAPKIVDDTVYTSGSQREVDNTPASAVLVVLLAAGLSGGAAECVFGRRAPALPQSWLFNPTESPARTSVHAQHDTLRMHPQKSTGGVSSFFARALRQRGLACPTAIASTAGLSALLFGSKTYMSEILAGDSSPIFSSAYAGALIATVQTPLHSIKSQIALQRASGVLATSFTDTAASLVRTQGFGSLLQNAPSIFGREIVGATLYFGTYEAIKETMRSGSTTSEPSSLTVSCAGATAGMLYKGFAHAFDNLLARPQAAPMSRSIVSTVLRAAPANAVLFLGYEAALASTGHQKS
jgi:hypothetical protein